MPNCANNWRATAPTATLAAVSRALERSSTLRRSLMIVFQPAVQIRMAWTRTVDSALSSSVPSTGSILMTRSSSSSLYFQSTIAQEHLCPAVSHAADNVSLILLDLHPLGLGHSLFAALQLIIQFLEIKSSYCSATLR